MGTNNVSVTFLEIQSPLFHAHLSNEFSAIKKLRWTIAKSSTIISTGNA